MSFYSPSKSELMSTLQTPLRYQNEPTKESLRLSQGQLNSQKKAQSEAKKARNDEATFDENIARIKNSSLTQINAFTLMQSEYSAYKNKTQLELQAANKKILELTWQIKESSGVSSGKEAQLASDLQILTEQIDYLRQKCAEETDQKKKLFDLIEGFQYQNKILQEDKRKLELNGLQLKNNQETKILKLEGDLNLSNQKLSAVEQEKRELEQKFLNINRGQIEVMVKDLENQLRKVDIQSALLKNEIFELKKEATENKHLLEMAQMESTHKQAQIDQQVRIIEQLNDKQGVLLSQEIEMKQSINEINVKYTKGDIKEKELLEEISVIKERNGQIKDKCVKLEKQNGLLVEQIAKMQEDVREIKEEKKQVLQEQVKQQEKFKEMEKLIAEMQQVMQELDEKKKKLEVEVAEKDKEIEEKRKEIERQGKELEEIKEERRRLEQQWQDKINEEEQIKMEQISRQHQWSEIAQSDKFQVMHTHRQTSCNTSNIMTPSKIYQLSSEKNTPFRISNQENDINATHSRNIKINDMDVNNFMNMIKIIQFPQDNLGNVKNMEKIDMKVDNTGKNDNNGGNSREIMQLKVERKDKEEESKLKQNMKESTKQDRFKITDKDVEEMIRKKQQSQQMKDQSLNKKYSFSKTTEDNMIGKEIDVSSNMNRNSNEQDLLLDSAFVESQKNKENEGSNNQEEISHFMNNNSEKQGNNSEDQYQPEGSLQQGVAVSQDNNFKNGINQIELNNMIETEMLHTDFQGNDEEQQIDSQIKNINGNTFENNDADEIERKSITDMNAHISRSGQNTSQNIEIDQEQTDQNNQQILNNEQEYFDEQENNSNTIQIQQVDESTE